MTEMQDQVRQFLASHPPFDLLSPETRDRIAGVIESLEVAEGDTIYRTGAPVAGLYAIACGTVEVLTATGEAISERRTGDIFGERGLFLDGRAPYDAIARTPVRAFLLPAAEFLALIDGEEGFARYFGRRTAPAAPTSTGAAAETALTPIDRLMSPRPVTIGAGESVADAARLMAQRSISCLMVVEDEALVGLVTTSDLCGRVLAEGRPATTPVGDVMTASPIALPREAVGVDALRLMAEHGIGHLPVTEGRRPVGIVTRTNLIVSEGLSPAVLLSGVAAAGSVADMAAVVARVPQLLAQMVGAGGPHQVVTRLVTDVTDAVTHRLLAMAEAELGPPPVPYLWAVCGSQGRQEQTGTSDQDNCLILSDEATPDDDAYFERLAR
ncbi:MAG: DUF294 nucleotidyltransferase-like domain-containing protein, partial [Pseudomonadota bacterium]